LKARTDDVAVHSERPSTEKFIRGGITFESPKYGI